MCAYTPFVRGMWFPLTTGTFFKEATSLLTQVSCGGRKFLCSLCSSSMWFWGGRPRHALKRKEIDTVTKTEEYQSPQSWQSLCWINMQPFRHRKSNRSTHLMMFSMEALWRKKALTTGVPDGTRGALHRKESSDKTLWKDWKFSSPWGFTVTRWQSSVSITRSRMIGLASRESC